MFLLVIVGLYLIYYSFPCASLSFRRLPPILSQNLEHGSREIVFLFGVSIQGTCPTGKYLNYIKDRADVLIVVPALFSDSEIQNFKESYMMKGTLIRSDGRVEGFLKSLASCGKIRDWKSNLHVKMERGKVGTVRII